MYLILIIAGTVALDQLVKHMVAGSMMLGQTIPVINNFFHITYIHNDGAAFGIMAGKAIFLIGLPALMMATGIVVLALFRKKLDPLVLIAIALITGGGTGNLIDRSIYGYVIDFIDFKIWNPIFNIADIAVCVGCGLIILYLLVIGGRKNGKSDKNNS